MKKLILTIAVATIAVASFAQGNFIFNTNARYVWDDWSANNQHADASNNVAFLWTTSGSAPLVAGVATSTATNSAPGSLTQGQVSTAWTDILTDPNFHLATNNGTGLLASAQTSTLGKIGYNAGGTFTVAGTSASGGPVNVYVIGWSSQYADPFSAAAAGSPVGWSSVFSYTSAAGPVPGPAGTPGDFSAGLTPFGVTSAIVAGPEPSTMALAAIGGASLLLFRRRK